MKRILQIIFLIVACSTLTNAQYIWEVLEYKPAPGQLINTSAWGNPSAANTIVGSINGALCLGAFGGCVVFRFENPVENHPDNPFGIDFTIFGNPQQSWAEPGIVWVMNDENQNGQPDDLWYELAGSDYWFSTTHKNYEITYFNPGVESPADVPWTDNLGNSGFIFANAAHPQPYYPSHDSFPAINAENYLLAGTMLHQLIDTLNPGFVLSPQRAFGYADNHLRGIAPFVLPDNPYTAQKENSGGDAMDISWAVDADGNYVDLDEIHFVKVQNAVNDHAGWLGEISTEITGAVDVEPNNAINGNLWLIVIKDLAPVITSQNYQLEVFAFYKGRLMPNENIVWQTSRPDANINENNQLTVTIAGPLEIKASLQNHPEISATASTMIDFSSASIFAVNSKTGISVYPNPANNYIHISGIGAGKLVILHQDGVSRCIYADFDDQKPIDISRFKPGFYLVRICNDKIYQTLKFIKN